VLLVLLGLLVVLLLVLLAVVLAVVVGVVDGGSAAKGRRLRFDAKVVVPGVLGRVGQVLAVELLVAQGGVAVDEDGDGGITEVEATSLVRERFSSTRY
jgi:hypothetical protein